MKNIPTYCKILTLGSRFTENALVGEVIIQEKLDGSLWRMGLNEDGELKMGSKSTIIDHPDENKMFKKVCEYTLSIENEIQKFPRDTYFYSEYLQNPRHNVLHYERVPLNNIMLFDVYSQGKFVKRPQLEDIARKLNVDVAPELYQGTLKDNPIEFLKHLIETTHSFLGNELIEGVVIKNYTQTILLGGNVFPLFTKYVRESYKERHAVEWKTNKSKVSLGDYIKSFKNENRWIKAILHLKERGLITQSPKDIGILIEEVKNDIMVEEQENIKEYLFKTFKEEILRNSIKGLPEYYKAKLLENVK